MLCVLELIVSWCSRPQAVTDAKAAKVLAFIFHLQPSEVSSGSSLTSLLFSPTDHVARISLPWSLHCIFQAL